MRCWKTGSGCCGRGVACSQRWRESGLWWVTEMAPVAEEGASRIFADQRKGGRVRLPRERQKFNVGAQGGRQAGVRAYQRGCVCRCVRLGANRTCRKDGELAVGGRWWCKCAGDGLRTACVGCDLRRAKLEAGSTQIEHRVAPLAKK